MSADGNIVVRLFFLMAISNRENGGNKNYLYRKGVCFKLVMINTIKCNLFFGLGGLCTKVFLCARGTVSSILCLIFEDFFLLKVLELQNLILSLLHNPHNSCF